MCSAGFPYGCDSCAYLQLVGALGAIVRFLALLSILSGFKDSFVNSISLTIGNSLN